MWLLEVTSSKVRFTISQSFNVSWYTLDSISFLIESLPDFSAGISVSGEQGLYWACEQFCVQRNA